MPNKRIVAAAIIKNSVGQMLICKRGPGGACAYLYEFPGGKTEPGESLSACLKRECREELCLEIEVEREIFSNEHRYPEIHVELHFFLCRTLENSVPQALEHEELRWVYPEQLGDFTFCPADGELIAKIQAGEIRLN